MKITVRLDDITSTMNWENFHRLEALLDKYDIVPLLGIVPDNRDDNLMRDKTHPEFSQMIQQWKEKGWVLAMHGWRHLYTTKNGGIFPLNSFGEFAGVVKEKQVEMIRDGKKKLEEMGIATDIFMAPAHSYDRNTLEALRQEGFRYVTDGFGTQPYRRQGMIFLPIAFKKDRDIGKPHGYTTLVFHTNTMKDEDFYQAGRLFEQYEKDFISFQEYMQAEPVEQTLVARAGEYTKARLKRFLIGLRQRG